MTAPSATIAVWLGAMRYFSNVDSSIWLELPSCVGHMLDENAYGAAIAIIVDIPAQPHNRLQYFTVGQGINGDNSSQPLP